MAVGADEAPEATGELELDAKEAREAVAELERKVIEARGGGRGGVGTGSNRGAGGGRAGPTNAGN